MQLLAKKQFIIFEKERKQMNPRIKGYYTSTCYMGWIPRFGQYIKFSTEEEYKEFFKEMENNHENPSH